MSCEFCGRGGGGCAVCRDYEERPPLWVRLLAFALMVAGLLLMAAGFVFGPK
jgi:hypothetical protein